MTDEQFAELIATLTYIGDELSDIALQTRGVDDHLEKLAEAGNSIANSLHCINLHQRDQVELFNGGFGFVRDISNKSDAGGAVYELMDSFNSKMQELINVITRK